MATVLVGAGGVVAVVTLAMRSPHVPGSYAVCPSLALFGVYCPGCGSLRAVHEVANGDIAGAWDMNPLAVLLLPFFAWAYVAWVRRSWFGATKKRLLPGWAVRAVGVAIIAYGMLRNVPALEPFLAP